MEMPATPTGNRQHPVCLTVITSADLDTSKKFYSELFGWRLMPLSNEVCACSTPAGQACALRTFLPEGFPAMVPFIRVDSIDAMVAVMAELGFIVEKPKWSAPNIGNMARVKAPSGVIYGLIEPVSTDLIPKDPLPSPFGNGPKPPVGAICALELYSGHFEFAAKFVGEHFGWGTAETMPQYMAFDTGAGFGGVFQGHTPSLPSVAYIYVDDVQAKIEQIEATGGTRMGDPMSMPGFGTFGYFSDPTGTPMGLIGPA